MLGKGILLHLLKFFGWQSLASGYQGISKTKHGSSKFSQHRKNNFKGKPKWDLVRSLGNGMGEFRCRQNGEIEVMAIDNLSTVSKDAQAWFSRPCGFVSHSEF